MTPPSLVGARVPVDILSAEGSAALSTLARAPALLAFDFDGTLAPIVGDPHRAAMSATTARAFATLCQLYPCAVISGRSRADVCQRLAEARPKYVVGNHGLERAAAGPQGPDSLAHYREATQRIVDELRPKLSALSKLVIEPKEYSLSLHYREVPHLAAARQACMDAVQTLSTRVRVVPGKMVLNVIPEGAPHKGDALRALCADELCQRALFVGDDVTDEDAFAEKAQLALVGVRVGPEGDSLADYYLPTQPAIDALLEALVQLRTPQNVP